MSLTKRNEVLFPALMNELFRPDWFGGTQNAKMALPAVNIKENELNFELELSVPGRSKDDFIMEIDESVLTISADNKAADTVSSQHFTRKEFTIASFKRAFTLPETVATHKIEATYDSGILKLTLPKKEEALPKPKRIIGIK